MCYNPKLGLFLQLCFVMRETFHWSLIQPDSTHTWRLWSGPACWALPAVFGLGLIMARCWSLSDFIYKLASTICFFLIKFLHYFNKSTEHIFFFKIRFTQTNNKISLSKATTSDTRAFRASAHVDIMVFLPSISVLSKPPVQVPTDRAVGQGGVSALTQINSSTYCLPERFNRSIVVQVYTVHSVGIHEWDCITHIYIQS